MSLSELTKLCLDKASDMQRAAYYQINYALSIFFFLVKHRRGFTFLSLYGYCEDGAAEDASSLVSKFVLW